MKHYSVALLGFVLLALLAFPTAINARKDPGEYWKNVMKDQPMPEAITGLVHSSSPLKAHDLPSMKATDCDHSDKKFTKDFEPRPNLSAYGHDEVKSNLAESGFVKDFEPRPNISAYDDDHVGVKEEKPFSQDFEPRPNISAYEDDRVGEKQGISGDFEPRPNISVYQD